MPADEFDPERILRVFADHGVDCLIVGGFGAQAHGAHRQTLDIDVIPRSTDANLERLAAALRDLGARLRVGGLTDDEARVLPVTVDAATLRSFVSSTWMTDAGPVDVLGDLPVAGGRRAYDEMVERAVPDRCTASSSTSHRSRTSSLLTGAMEITCADCGCRVDRGEIVEACDGHPGCCCSHLTTRALGDTDLPSDSS